MATVTLLETIGLSKNFEGLQAVDDVGLVIPAGEIRAVIGPNGAGKTTLVSLVSGRLKPTQGSIRFKGEDITGLQAWDRVRSGDRLHISGHKHLRQPELLRKRGLGRTATHDGRSA